MAKRNAFVTRAQNSTQLIQMASVADKLPADLAFAGNQNLKGTAEGRDLSILSLDNTIRLLKLLEKEAAKIKRSIEFENQVAAPIQRAVAGGAAEYV